MNVIQAVRPWALSFGVALIYDLTIVYFWGYLPRYNPITKWLLSSYGGTDWYYPLVHFHDSIVNILLAVPFAYLILRIKPDRRWMYVAFVVLAVFIWEYRIVLFVRRNFFEFVSMNGSAFFGAVSVLLILPAALLILTVLERRRSAA